MQTQEKYATVTVELKSMSNIRSANRVFSAIVINFLFIDKFS